MNPPTRLPQQPSRPSFSTAPHAPVPRLHENVDVLPAEIHAEIIAPRRLFPISAHLEPGQFVSELSHEYIDCLRRWYCDLIKLLVSGIFVGHIFLEERWDVSTAAYGMFEPKIQDFLKFLRTWCLIASQVPIWEVEEPKHFKTLDNSGNEKRSDKAGGKGSDGKQVRKAITDELGHGDEEEATSRGFDYSLATIQPDLYGIVVPEAHEPTPGVKIDDATFQHAPKPDFHPQKCELNLDLNSPVRKVLNEAARAISARHVIPFRPHCERTLSEFTAIDERFQREISAVQPGKLCVSKAIHLKLNALCKANSDLKREVAVWVEKAMEACEKVNEEPQEVREYLQELKSKTAKKLDIKYERIEVP